MWLFRRGRPKFLCVCFRLAVTSQLSWGSADPCSQRTRLERAPRGPLGCPLPKATSHADAQMSRISAVLSSAHSALAARSAKARAKATHFVISEGLVVAVSLVVSEQRSRQRCSYFWSGEGTITWSYNLCLEKPPCSECILMASIAKCILCYFPNAAEW